MLSLAREDDVLDGLVGADIASERAGAITYRPLRRLGAGGMATVFLALRAGPEGQCPVVIKVLRPTFVRKLGDKATLTVRKEVVSLARLNEQVPPTPFVVRLIDAGSLRVDHGGRPLALPWLAVEHVHGGPEGTTLHERVAHTIRHTGEAFDPDRAARALRFMSAGLAAVHEAGVIHRDIKPDNILCCGFGENELLKVADFGIARPYGIDATFGFVVGTPGYAAPEAAGLDGTAIGPWTDVFGLAAVTYYMLTGEHYLPIGMTPGALPTGGLLRSLLDARATAAALRDQADACRAIDAALSRATAPDPRERTQAAAAFCAEVTPFLEAPSRWPRASSRRPDQLIEEQTTMPGTWTWSVLHRPAQPAAVRDVGWDADGRCLAATDRGLLYWDGTAWRDAPVTGLPSPNGIRFVRRVAPGQWVIGGDQGTFATYGSSGVRDVVRGDPSMRFDLMSGDLHDVAVLSGTSAAGTPTLMVLAAHRWMKPFPIFDAASIRALSPLDDARWLIAGRGTDGNAYAAVFAPFDREIVRLPAGGLRELWAGASAVPARRALAAGRDGAVLWCEEGATRAEKVSPAQDLTCAALDVVGCGWVAGRGRAWLRRRGADGTGRWVCVWEDGTWPAPVVSMLADIGLVLAVSSDGGVLEGKATLGAIVA